jgi:hypothetical protein
MDDVYKEATKAVVDDAMRTDTLGARLCVVLEEHKPANDALHRIIKTALQSNQEVKKALKSALDEIDNRKKAKWIDRSLTGSISVAVTLLVAYLSSFFR